MGGSPAGTNAAGKPTPVCTGGSIPVGGLGGSDAGIGSDVRPKLSNNPLGDGSETAAGCCEVVGAVGGLAISGRTAKGVEASAGAGSAKNIGGGWGGAGCGGVLATPKSCSLFRPSVDCADGNAAGGACPLQAWVLAANGSNAATGLGACRSAEAGGSGVNGPGPAKPKFAVGMGWMGVADARGMADAAMAKGFVASGFGIDAP